MKNWVDLAPRDKFVNLGGGLSIYVEPIVGDLHITVYRFEPGAVLPAHSHMPHKNHISIIALGALKAMWSNGEQRILPAGSVIDLEECVSHEFHECLGAPAVLVNIRRMGGTGQEEVGEMERIKGLIAGLKSGAPVRALTAEELRERGFVHVDVNRGV